MNYQKIILSGNATGNAQVRKSRQGDVTFATFSLAVADGKDRTTFFPIVVFGRSVEKLASLITKGRQILLDGRIQVAKDRFDVIADRLELGVLPKNHQGSTQGEEQVENSLEIKDEIQETAEN